MSLASLEHTKNSEGANRNGYIDKIVLSNFRSHLSLNMVLGENAGVTVLYGPNGCGKTNALEALSLLVPGQGLQGAPYPSMITHNAPPQSVWSVFGHINTAQSDLRIGTSLKHIQNPFEEEAAYQRFFHLNERACRSEDIHAVLRMAWLTPDMDHLFTQSISTRRRFLDRLVAGIHPPHTRLYNAYEQTMRERNKILFRPNASHWLDAVERQMAEYSVTLAASRLDFLEKINHILSQNVDTLPFAPMLSLGGEIEEKLKETSALDVENFVSDTLKRNRQRDKDTGRAHLGAHRCSFMLEHAKKGVQASVCSTGEQRHLLLALMINYSRLLAFHVPCFILLLDDVLAHLDRYWSQHLSHALQNLGLQVFVTGASRESFKTMEGSANFLSLERA